MAQQGGEAGKGIMMKKINRETGASAKNWAANGIPVILGMLLVVLTLVPAMILGEKGYFLIHDQADGEILGYILNARHFLEDRFPEFMNGMRATSLTPPSWGTVIFYMLLPPFEAYMANYIFVTIVAFVGMFLLLDTILPNDVKCKKWICGIVAVLFSQLPFYSVYGLSIMGQPLLLYSCIRLWNNRKPWLTYGLTVLFAVFSSLVLVGYVDVILLICMAAVMQFRRHPSARRMWGNVLLLIAVYVLLNLSLLRQILLPGDDVSHKTEILATAVDFASSFTSLFVDGQYHAESLHTKMVGWALALILAAVLFYSRCSEREQKFLAVFMALVAAAALIAVFYAFWRWEPVVNLRQRLGGLLISFQIDRFYWLYPTIWFVILGCMVWLILYFTKQTAFRRICGLAAAGILLVNMGSAIYERSVFKKNMETIQTESYKSTFICWEELYSTELFAQIEEYIGLPQEDYRVASFALYPSVPLYNGFYCIDGYSNNYDLDYKHAFRDIIAQEIEKSEWIREYFDDWGNRCYLFSAELGNKYFFVKGSAVVENLQLSSDALKELNCDYILSGVEIKNPEESGLQFEKSFEHVESMYRIYLYKVT